ncbi:helix-turn-helix transcriptional regulator [Haliea sp.]|uniref:helix-turn-helix transcriptional regulator n=1 Tax=Haliea sp. TaxID=1932666 RepID=UPI0035294D48
MATTILRLPSVLRERGRSRSAHYLDIQLGLFTAPVPLGPRAVGWPDYEVDAINSARIAGCSDAEIRALVRQLLARRKLLLPSVVRDSVPVTRDDEVAKND